MPFYQNKIPSRSNMIKTNSIKAAL